MSAFGWPASTSGKWASPRGYSLAINLEWAKCVKLQSNGASLARKEELSFLQAVVVSASEVANSLGHGARAPLRMAPMLMPRTDG